MTRSLDRNRFCARATGCSTITSVAGERGRPRNYTYGSAKAGLNVYLDGRVGPVTAAPVDFLRSAVPGDLEWDLGGS